MNHFRTSLCALAFAASGIAASLPAAAQGTMPSCPGDVVVWENTSTKVYHEQGDAYFGKTKHGQYACKADADKAGMHLSKSKSKSGSASTSTDSDATSTDAPAAGASPAPSASPKGKHHHNKGSAMMASPAPGMSAMPGMMASPAATASPTGKHHHHKKHGASASPSPGPSATM
jgi:hypothetical protein